MTSPDPPGNQDPKSSEPVNAKPPSTSTGQNASLPSNLTAVVWKIGSDIRRHIGTWGIVAVTAILLLVFYVGLDLAGIEKCHLLGKYIPCDRLGHPGNKPPPNVDSKPSQIIDSNYSSFVDAARKEKKPYLIEGATMIAEIEDVKETRRFTLQITYTIRALTNITRANPVFHEWYEPTSPTDFVHWSGTEEEQWTTTIGSQYDVKFDMKEGELKTFTTGVYDPYTLPLASNRLELGGKLPLGANEDHVTYTNSGDGADYICNLTIIVRSRTTALQPFHENKDNAAVAVTAEKGPEFSSARFSPLVPEKNGWHTLSASWSYVPPGKDVGIVFQWP